MSKKHKPHIEDDESWLMTFADMITLLLCFFIILLSMMEPKRAKFEEVKEGMMSEFTSEEVATPFNSILDSFNSIVEMQQVSSDVSVEETEKGVIIEINSEFLFQSGSAKIRKEAVPFLEQVAYSLVGFEQEAYVIEVEGHTDDAPIKTQQYPTNWHLSSARSISVVRYFMYMGLDPLHLKASGFADTRPKVPNRDEAGTAIVENQSINRRVVIRVERE